MGEGVAKNLMLSYKIRKSVHLEKTFGGSCHMLLKGCGITFDDDNGSADKEEEKVWSRNAFALVGLSSPLACFPYFPSRPLYTPLVWGWHLLVWGWHPPCMGREPFFTPFYQLAPLSSHVQGVTGRKRHRPFFAFHSNQSGQKVAAQCIRGVVSIHR